MGSFASFMAALAQIFDPIKRLTNVAARMQKMLVSAESVFTLIDQKPEIDQGTRTLPEPVRGRVNSEASAIASPTPTATRCTTCPSPSSPARPWRWWAARAAARPRW